MVAGSPEDFVTVGWVVLGVLGRFSLALSLTRTALFSAQDAAEN